MINPIFQNKYVKSLKNYKNMNLTKKINNIISQKLKNNKYSQKNNNNKLIHNNKLILISFNKMKKIYLSYFFIS